MKMTKFIGFSLLTIGLLLLRETRKKRRPQLTVNGISFTPTAVFILNK